MNFPNLKKPLLCTDMVENPQFQGTRRCTDAGNVQQKAHGKGLHFLYICVILIRGIYKNLSFRPLFKQSEGK